MRATVAFASVVVVVVVAGCDLRSAFAQSPLFEVLRPGLIEDCCTCLADSLTNDSTATCTQAVIVNGEIATPGAVFGSADVSIPCLCQGDRDTCIQALSTQGEILVPGACIDQLEVQAPCESACAGVLSFVPVSAP